MGVFLTAVMFLASVITEGRNVVLTAFKGCLKPGNQTTCGKEVVVTGAGVFLRITRKCCDSDNCNGKKIKVNPVNMTLNGYKCPTCYTNNSTIGCTPVGDFLCVGKEDQCATFTRSGSKPGEPVKWHSVSGCATTDACDIGHFSIASSKIQHFDVKCIPSNKV
ncbi:protein RoBo-1-like isoform X2 [Lissotriton helveticus]